MTMENVPPGQMDAAGKKAVSGGAIATGGGLALLIIFMAQNRDDVTLDFLWWTFTWPTWLVVLASAVLGGIIWIGIGILRRMRRRRERRAERRN
jgi:uncharacterized integral membrane protein